MKNWSYYDLMTKIEVKAKEYGINVVKLPYKQIQMWCTSCNSLTVEKVTYDSGEVKYVCSECGEVFELDRIVQKAVSVQNMADIIKIKKTEDDNSKADVD